MDERTPGGLHELLEILKLPPDAQVEKTRFRGKITVSIPDVKTTCTYTGEIEMTRSNINEGFHAFRGIGNGSKFEASVSVYDDWVYQPEESNELSSRHTPEHIYTTASSSLVKPALKVKVKILYL